MMANNNKGFSMVEILAVVVILGVISTIGIVSVTRLVDNSKKHYYDAQQDQMVLAAQAYTNDHRNKLPKMVGQRSKITLKMLYDGNYIKEQINDKNKGKCDELKSYVNVYKSSQSEYKYRGYLNCPACEDETGYCYKETTSNPPVVEIKFPTASGNNLYNGEKNIELEMKANGDNANIGSYSYKIYVDKRLVFNSGNKKNGKRREMTVKEEIRKYLPGSIRVVATITNTDGETRTYSKTGDFKDDISPACGKVKYDGSYAMDPYKPGDNVACGQAKYPWINIGTPNATRHAWIECDAVFGIGCSQAEFSRDLKTDGEIENIQVKDTKGYTSNCPVLKCIDKTTPKLVINLKNGSDVKDTITVNGQSSVKNYSTSYVYPNWLNKSAYPNGVTIEVKVIEPSSKIKTFKWYQNEGGQKENAIGSSNQKVFDVSSIVDDDYNKENEYVKSTKIEEDGVRREFITVLDKAGNQLSYTLTLKIDLTDPSCGSVSGGNKTWSKAASVTCSMGCSDGMSGCTQNSFSTTVTDQVATKSVSFAVKDNAGNTNNSCTGTCNIYLDRTPPTITNLKTTNDGYTISATIGDGLSGLKSYQFEGKSSKSASGASQPVSVDTGTTNDNGKLKLTVYDQANNSNTGTATGVYKLCSKTAKKDDFSIYHWKNMTKHCGSYYRKYDFEQYLCDCTMDKKDDGYVCSHKVTEYTMEGHGSYTSIIYYHHTANGKAACKGDKYPNSYIDQVCSSDNWFAGQDDWGYHGYRFFDGAASGKWLEFDGNGWTYWGKHMIDVNLGAKAACKQACEYKFD